MKVLLSLEQSTLRSAPDSPPPQNPIFGRGLEGQVTWITEFGAKSDEFPPHQSHLSLWSRIASKVVRVCVAFAHAMVAPLRWR